MQKVVPALMKEFGYKNLMQVPKLERIVLNVGMGEAIQNVKLLESAAEELGVITGQKPVVTKARRPSPASSCAKECRSAPKSPCEVIECMSFSIVWSLWRFRGFATFEASRRKSFDGRGNYTLGLKEQLIFPEIKYDAVASIHGMDITIVTTARTNDEGKALLKHLGMPFRT